MTDANLNVATLSKHAFSTPAWTGGALVILATSLLLLFLVSRIKKTNKQISIVKSVARFFYTVAKKPCILLFVGYLAYEMLVGLFLHFPELVGHKRETMHFAKYCLRIIDVVAFCWFVLKTLNLGQLRIEQWAIQTNHRILSYLMPVVGNSLKGIVILMMLNMVIPELGLTGLMNEVLQKTAKVVLILVLGGVFWQVINAMEKIILNQYDIATHTDAMTRKINTQVHLLKKIILTLGTIIIVAALLMVFDSVKNLGTGLLTTAGLLSAAGAFASQQSLSRIFSGLQIAFTQPITIGDTIIVDNESGEIEEITLFYIVVKMWDLRRIVLPTDYFSSKGLQNLTRYSKELLGTIFYYVDYTIPVDEVRAEFQRLVAASPLWNKHVCNFNVTSIQATCIELRGLVSADTSKNLSGLRMLVREQLMKFIVDHYPQCLVRSRQSDVPKLGEQVSVEDAV